MKTEATYSTHKLDACCCEPGCLARPTRIGLAVFWGARATEVYAWCDEHAAAAMDRVRKEGGS